MRLSEILKLNESHESLSIIKNYLEQPLNQNDYQAAFNHYFKIALALNLPKLVKDEAKDLISSLKNQVDTPYYEQILGSLINALIKLEQYDEALKYIKDRKQVLPVKKAYLGIIDDINYKKAINASYKDELLHLLEEVIPDNIKIDCLSELLTIYQKEGHYELALNMINELYKMDLYSDFFNDELKILLKIERLDEIKVKALNHLRNYPNHAYSVYALLNVYYLTNELLKASDLEAQYEEVIDLEDDEFKAKTYKLIIKIYEKLKNKFSIDIYQKKLKAITRNIEKTRDKKTEQEPVSKEVIIVEKPVLKTPQKKAHLIHFEYLEDILFNAASLNQKLETREFLRQFFMLVDKNVKAKDYIIYLNSKNTPNFYHYKSERLYDKTVLNATLDETVIKECMASGEDIFEQTKNIKWPKNVLTQKEYEEDIKFLYCFPIGDLGVFLVYLDKEQTDSSIYYDFYKIISLYLFAYFKNNSFINRLKKDNRFYEKLLSNPFYAYRELREERSFYNETSQKLFNIDKHFHLELFLRDLSYDDVHNYKDTIKKLFSMNEQSAIIHYNYQEKAIIEYMYAIKIEDEVVIISQFFDETLKIKRANELLEKATIDNETSLNNLFSLKEDINNKQLLKASFILIDLDIDINHLYGREKTMNFFKEFGQLTKKFFNEKTYRYYTNQVLVIIEQNDIRSVTKLIKDYLKHLETYESKIIPYESYRVKISIVRYPVVTINQQKDRILRYLEIGLEKAKRMPNENYVFFTYKDYEDEVFEQQVIDHLNEAIENKALSLNFIQITDINKNRIWQYESQLYLENLTIDSKYLYMIAKKRNRLIQLEYYHIIKVCEFLVNLEKETSRLIKLTIPISKETFLNSGFNSFILGTLKKHEIPYEFIRLKLDMELRPNQYTTLIKELIDVGITLDTTSIDMCLNYPFSALHLEYKRDNEKWNNYLLKIKTMLDEFNMNLVVRMVKTKEQRDSLKELGISFIEGDLYKELGSFVLINKIKESL